MSNDGNVYDKAREVLRQRGWYQGSGIGPNGSVCALQALAFARGVDSWTTLARETEQTLLAVIREQFPDRVQGRDDLDVVWNFNDADGTVVADVDLVLDKAARAWDEQHSGGAA